MSLDRHINALKQEHRELDNKITHMETSNSFDDETLMALKRHRLHLKDEITRLQKINLKLITQGIVKVY